MRYRRFKAPDGKYLDALLTCDGEFSVSAESHKADHETGYGVSPLTVIDGDSDPWDGVSVLIQRPPRTLPRAPRDTLITELRAATSLAEAKAALIKFHEA